jgi:YesN/AraC family two-component response regulator
VKTILAVDDEPRTRQGIRRTLEAWSAGRFRIETAESGIAALEWLEMNSAQLILCDVRMPELGGLQLLERLEGRQPMPAVILISGYAEFEYAQQAIRLGVVEYLLKPLETTALIRAVEKALRHEAERERLEMMERLVDPKLLEAGQKEAKFGRIVKDAMAYVDEHLNEPIGMMQAARHLHLNASYFSSLFKEQTGLTFSEYLTRRRLQRAKELLATTGMPIWEIAEKVGYHSAKYFIKVFKDSESVSPGHYRHMVANVSNIIQ